jgi:hypothetical protein
VSDGGVRQEVIDQRRDVPPTCRYPGLRRVAVDRAFQRDVDASHLGSLELPWRQPRHIPILAVAIVQPDWSPVPDEAELERAAVRAGAAERADLRLLGPFPRAAPLSNRYTATMPVVIAFLEFSDRYIRPACSGLKSGMDSPRCPRLGQLAGL